MNKFGNVNKVLMEWNPLGVIGPALSDEYLGLIPLILSQENKYNLESFLKQFMYQKYGLEYRDLNQVEEMEFYSVINNISKIIFD